MAEQYIGAGVAAGILGYTERHFRYLRTEGAIPDPEVEIEEASGRRLPGWSMATLQKVKRDRAAQNVAPVQGPPPRRYLGMSTVARRYGLSVTRGYEREEDARQRRNAGGDGWTIWPPHAVELLLPNRSEPHRGWDPAVVEAAASRLHRTPGRPHKHTGPDRVL